MRTAPKVGQRVKYFSRDLEEHEGVPRECTGTVMAIYESWDDSLRLEPESQWSVGIKVDEIPKWWPYPGSNRFAPQVSELELI